MKLTQTEAQDIFLDYYKNNPRGLIKDLNTKANKIYSPRSPNGFRYAHYPNLYDFKNVDDNSKIAKKWILNNFFKNIEKVDLQDYKNHEKKLTTTIKEYDECQNTIKTLSNLLLECQKNKNTQTNAVYNFISKSTQHDIKENKENLKHLKEKVNSLKSIIETTKKENEIVLKNIMNESVNEYSKILQSVIDEYKEKEENYKTIITSKDETINTIKNALQQQQETNKKQKIVLSSIKEKQNVLNNTLKQYESENKIMRDEIKFHKEQIELLNKQSETITQKFLTKINKLEELLKSQNEKLIKNNEKIQQESTKLKNTIDPQELLVIKNKIITLENTNNKLNDSIIKYTNNLNENNENLKIMKEELKQKNEYYANFKKEHEKSIKILEDKIINLLKEKEECYEELKLNNNYKKENDILIESLKLELKSEKEKFKLVKDELQEVKIIISKIVKEHEEYVKLITIQNEKLKSENEILKNKIQQLTQIQEKKVQKETVQKQQTLVTQHNKEILNFENAFFIFQKDQKFKGSISIKEIQPEFSLNALMTFNFNNSELNYILSKDIKINRIGISRYEFFTLTDEKVLFYIEKQKGQTQFDFINNLNALNLLFQSKVSFFDIYKIKKQKSNFITVQ